MTQDDAARERSELHTKESDAAMRISRGIVKLILAGMVIQVLVIGYVAIATSAWHSDLVDSQRDGCERIKLDRVANASGWRIAEDARRASGEEEVARRYGRLAHQLEERSRIDCRKAYP